MALLSSPFSIALAGTILSFGLLLIFIPSLFTFIPTRYRQSADARNDHIQILVLGDIGRSPRMQYHALSIVRHGGTVDLVGYYESALHPELNGHERVGLFPLPQLPGLLKGGRLPFVLSGPLKVIWQIWSIFYVLAYSTPPARWIVIQNPPSIPTLHLAVIISILRGSHILVDWHNYGWSILATTRGRSHRFVQAYLEYEAFFGRLAPTANLTVTDAMARQLRRPPYSFTKPILTLHDRPADIFQPIVSATEREAALSRIPDTKAVARSIVEGDVRLIVSSTSWTPDEDFGLLLDALVDYSADDTNKKRLLAIITGKGPQKAMYEEKVAQLTREGRLSRVTVLTAWLSTEDYASLLACADLGICLHKSSSGVDLPMKVVDMFGSGLPVAAYSDYESFGELVRVGENGCGFETGWELADILAGLLRDEGEAELALLKEGAIREGSLRWDAEWDRVVGRVIGLVDP